MLLEVKEVQQHQQKNNKETTEKHQLLISSEKNANWHLQKQHKATSIAKQYHNTNWK